MELFITTFVASFFSFIFAQIIAPIVAPFFSRRDALRAEQIEHDKTLAIESLHLLPPKKLDKATDDIYSGIVTYALLRRIDDFIEMQKRWRFNDKAINVKFAGCAEALNMLREFTLAEYDDYAAGRSVKFHRPLQSEGGDEKYQRLLKERKELVRSADASYENYLREVGRCIPAVLREIIQHERVASRSKRSTATTSQDKQA